MGEDFPNLKTSRALWEPTLVGRCVGSGAQGFVFWIPMVVAIVGSLMKYYVDFCVSVFYNSFGNIFFYKERMEKYEIYLDRSGRTSR